MQLALRRIRQFMTEASDFAALRQISMGILAVVGIYDPCVYLKSALVQVRRNALKVKGT